jgi:hypothetical protein
MKKELSDKMYEACRAFLDNFHNPALRSGYSCEFPEQLEKYVPLVQLALSELRGLQAFAPGPALPTEYPEENFVKLNACSAQAEQFLYNKAMHESVSPDKTFNIPCNRLEGIAYVLQQTAKIGGIKGKNRDNAV